MPDSFTVLWTQERCRWLKRVGDAGPLSVIFGGPHISMPPIHHVRVGDFIYPVLVADGGLFVIARLAVQKIISPDDYLMEKFGFTLPLPSSWSSFVETLKRDRPEIGHRIPQSSCADRAAVGEGTEIRFDRRVPDEMLPLLRLGPKPGREQPLGGLEGTRLKHNLAFQGHVRRLSAESAEILAGLINTRRIG